MSDIDRSSAVIQSDVPDTFCAYSVFHINIGPDGRGTLCCRAGENIAVNQRALSLHHDSFDAMWNSQYMRDTRRRMVTGAPVDACAGCYRMEREGGKSLRIHANTCEETERRGGLRSVYADARRIVFDHQGRAPLPSSLHFWLGNLCNLKCRMCSPHFSSQIAADPIHSKWTTGSAGLARRVVLLPDFLPHVEYVRWGDVHVREDRPYRLLGSRNEAFVGLAGTGDPLHSIEVAGFNDGPGTQTLTISIGEDFSIERRVDVGRWRVPVALDRVLDSRRIELRFRASAPLAVDYLAVVSAPPVGKAFPKEFVSRFSENPKWFENETVLFDEILAAPESIHFINFAGGEPLVHERIGDILALFVEKGLSKRVGLYFSTNGTVKSPKLTSLLRQFRNVGLGISIDGVGALQEYIRFPSSWAQVQQNIVQYQREGVASVSVQPTPQAYNVFGLLELVRFCDAHDLWFTLNNVLSFPRYLSFEMLPQVVADEALVEWRTYRDTDCRAEMLGEVDTLIGALEGRRQAPSVELQRQFIEFTAEMDRARGQRLRDASPRLYDRLCQAGFEFTD
jgi:hypothetical protein